MRSLCCYPMGKRMVANSCQKAPFGSASTDAAQPAATGAAAEPAGGVSLYKTKSTPSHRWSSAGRWLQWGLAERRRAQMGQVPDTWAAVHAPANEPKKSPVKSAGRLRRRRAFV